MGMLKQEIWAGGLLKRGILNTKMFKKTIKNKRRDTNAGVLLVLTVLPYVFFLKKVLVNIY